MFKKGDIVKAKDTQGFMYIELTDDQIGSHFLGIIVDSSEKSIIGTDTTFLASAFELKDEISELYNRFIQLLDSKLNNHAD